MALIIRLRILIAISLLLLRLPLISAQSTGPAANTSVTGNAPPLFIMDTTVNNMATHINLYPLTNDAGLVGSPTQLLVCRVTTNSRPADC